MRRTRFTVTCSKPRSTAVERVVILAYNAGGAQSFFEQRGYTVVRVEAGDYRHTFAAESFRIDQTALSEAKAFFGLKWPVTIRTHARRGGKYGHCAFQMVGGKPRIEIMVKSYLSPEQASKTLWHELTHAMQYERSAAAGGCPREAAWRMHRANKGIAYRAKPCEVEAREHEVMHDTLPLCR